ncbi:hypothetical protein Barb6XT_01902 [Bacteroidales bacterium Barb6XT]|nr:hypothetical protein Barb6XT_01902 [Bacteroidales bacterium Barb6XT]
MKPAFAIPEVFSTSWIRTKEQIWILAGLFIGFVTLSFSLSILLELLISNVVSTIIVALVTAFLHMLLALGYYKNIFQALDETEPQFSAYGKQAKKVFTYIVVTIISGVILIVGLTLFIVPGVYMGLRLQFYIAFIVEEDAGIIESLKRSWNLTKGHTKSLLVLWLAMFGIVILGTLLLLVGLFAAIPLVCMMQCYAYRKLMEAHDSVGKESENNDNINDKL